MRAELRLTTEQFQLLHQCLLPDDAEHAAILACGSGPDGLLLCRSVTALGPDDLEPTSGRLHLDISPLTLARAAKAAAQASGTIVVCHSHPFPGPVAASLIDLETESELCGRVLPGRVGGRAVGALILGPDGYDARIWRHGRSGPLAVVVDGRSPRTAHLDDANRDEGRFDRQLLLWGVDGQARLRHARVGIVGVGGTGSHVVVQLAHLGIGHLVLVDDDVIERSNLSRIVGATAADVGQTKVDVLASVVARIRHETTVESLPESVLEMNTDALATCDLIVCCTDNHGSRAVLTELAAQYLVPLVDLGIEVQRAHTGTRAGGGVRVVRPGEPCLHCMGVLDPAIVREDFLTNDQRLEEAARGYLHGVAEPAPSVVALNGVVSSLAVVEVLDLLLGLFERRPPRLLYRAETRSVTTAGVTRDAGCFVCGHGGLTGLGDARALPRRSHQPRAGSA